MMRLWLKCLCVFSVILGLGATNGVYRVSRQDFPTNRNPSAAAYQQPFERSNGVYRVQRQDFTNGNDVPFSDSYPSSYGNRFSKLGSGDLSPSHASLPKLFLPAGVPRTENPYLAIGVPNYDRVMPASDYGKEAKARTSAPTRINLRPKSTIYDERQYDDGALPALPNYPSYDSALPSISEYSKSSPFDEDFSLAVEQFNMTEDKKSICTGANCRESNSNDDADAVKPIRRRRSIDYDPYNSFGRPNHYEPHTHLYAQLYHRTPYHSRLTNNPFYDHEYDRVYSYLSSLSRNRPNRFEPSTDESTATDGEVSTEPTETPTPPIDFPQYDENSSNDNVNEFYSSSSWIDPTMPAPEPNIDDFEFSPEGNSDPLLSLDFEAVVASAEPQFNQETASSDDFNFDHAASTTETLETTTDPSLEDGMNYTPIECDFLSETSDSGSNFDSAANPTETLPDTGYDSEVTTNSNEISTDSEYQETTSDDFSLLELTDPTETEPDSENSETTTTQTPEERTEDDIPTNDKKLLLEYKFRVTFVCTMWPEIYQKSKFDLYDSRDKNMYHLCKFFNALNAHSSDASDTESNCDDESETSTDKNSISDESLLNFLTAIFQGNKDGHPSRLSSDANADSNAETGFGDTSGRGSIANADSNIGIGLDYFGTYTLNNDLKSVEDRTELTQMLSEFSNDNGHLSDSERSDNDPDSALFSSPDIPMVIDISIV